MRRFPLLVALLLVGCRVDNSLEKGGDDDNSGGTEDSGLPDCVPEEEVCDGVDNDCVGGIDEGQEGLAEACAVDTCGDVLAANPGSADGVYWILDEGNPERAYCDMAAGVALCSEGGDTWEGVTRDASALPFTLEGLLLPDSATCEIWAVRHSVDGTAFGPLEDQVLDTCQALGFVGDVTLGTCLFGSLEDSCGFTDDLFYRYGNQCSGCTVNDGAFDSYVRQGEMESARVLSTFSGTVRTVCLTE